jgi:hypothetical protein
MTPQTNLENYVERRVIADFGESDGKAIWGNYMQARKLAFDDIAPIISKYEPSLSDHSERHILNVLKNAYELIGEEALSGTDTRTALSASELFLLVNAILFHDLGNFFGRKEHNKRLDEAIEYARGNTINANERRSLTAIVEAHCGHTRDGSRDTIGSLDSAASFKTKRLDCRRVAAILRLADELAEGPQRTSVFESIHKGRPSDSEVFHDYAEVTDVYIDRAEGRIVLTYDIDLSPPSWGSRFNQARLRRLLSMCEKRALKLDGERRYNAHYCSILRPFKKTEVSFHFHVRKSEIQVNLPKITLDDLVLPEANGTLNFKSKCPEFDVPTLVRALKEKAKSK